MNDSTQRNLILAATSVGSFFLGSMFMNHVRNCNERATKVMLANGVGSILDKINEENVNPQEVVDTMNEEFEFIMIALKEG